MSLLLNVQVLVFFIAARNNPARHESSYTMSSSLLTLYFSSLPPSPLPLFQHATLPLMVLAADLKHSTEGYKSHTVCSKHCKLWGQNQWDVTLSLNRSLLIYRSVDEEQARKQASAGRACCCLQTHIYIQIVHMHNINKHIVYIQWQPCCIHDQPLH